MYKIIKVEGAVIMGNVIPFEQITSGKYFNGERLRIARTWRGYSAIQLAEMIGVNRQTISMYENGKLDSPEFPTIQKISEALRFPVKFFLEDIKVDVEKSATYFRSLLTTNKKYRVEQEDKIKFIAVIYNMLNEYLEFEKLNLPQIPQNTSPQEAAEILRKQWRLGNKPIENIVYLELRRRGFTVYIGKFADKEIDFIATKQNEKVYVQVCRTLPEDSDREIDNLKLIKDNYPKYVISMTPLVTRNDDNGITHMHLRNFLMLDSLD